MAGRARSQGPGDAASGVAPFIALTYAITWLMLLPAALAQRGVLAAPRSWLTPLVVVGYLAPTSAAAVLAGLEGRGDGLRNLVRGLGVWRVGVAWYVAALALPGAVFVVTRAVVGLVTGGDTGPWLYPPDARHVAAMVVVPLTDQIGWRGFAFPRAEIRYGTLRATLGLGLVWGLWHLTKQALVGDGAPLPIAAVLLALFVSGSVVFTWIYRRARDSLLLVVLAQAGFYLDNPSQALPGHAAPLIIQAAGYCLLALGLLAADRKVWRGDAAGRDPFHAAAS
ncbi:MAG TPA: type II CAAX endopeptidase family protein [Polyangiaceae bacterium]|nr:type II CAAX endopeptidase family protein [Polyangiaceae bacterium]